MKVNFYFEPNDGGFSTQLQTFQRFYDYCKDNITTFEPVFKNSLEYRKPETWTGPSSKYGPWFLVIENDETKKYILVSYWDKLVDVLEHQDSTFWDTENCLEIITSIGLHSEDYYYLPRDYEYTPFSYLVCTLDSEEAIEKAYHSNVKKTIPPKPKFRGALYNFREFLKQDDRFLIISKNDENLSYEDYIYELSEEPVSISLNGGGEICHRDIEIMGLGNVLIRQELVVNFHDPLIPNYHYIAVPHLDLGEYFPREEYWQIMADRFHETYQRAIQDPDLIARVSKNAREWYEKNGTIDKNVEILKTLVNFEKLKG